jgi:L-cysteine desulfidase
MQENILKLLLVFLVISCNYQSDESLKIRVKVIDYRTEEGQKNVLVEMGEMKKPIFRMWYYHKVVESYTDSKGEVILQLKKIKTISLLQKMKSLKTMDIWNIIVIPTLLATL